VTYNLIPGLRFFRGQERAVFVVANSLAILTGLGVASAATWANQAQQHIALKWWRRLTLIIVVIAIVAFVGSRLPDLEFGNFADIAIFSVLIAISSGIIIRAYLKQPTHIAVLIALITVIVFDLFTVNMDNVGTYDATASTEQLSITPPPLVAAVLQDDNTQPARVDGFRGLQDNFGSLYEVMDMRGISPLFLTGPQRVIYRNYVNNPLAWELYAVKYVYSESDTLSVPSTIIAEGNDRDGYVYLHQLDNPRPFAHLVYNVGIVDSDDFANALMDDPNFDERHSIALHAPPTQPLPDSPADGTATVTQFEPERITINIDTRENAILSLSLPHYAGWHAELDDNPADIIRAYGGLSAVEVSAGTHQLHLYFAPMSYTIGALMSLITWLGLGLLAIVTVIRR
jgi:hypothetical protein